MNLAVIQSLRLASTTKRVWLGAVALAAFVATLVVGNCFLRADRSVTRQMLGHDFLAFYTAGSLVRQGRASSLYDLETVRAFEQSTAAAYGLEVGKSFGPWWNPPFYALLFSKLSTLPYPVALEIWRDAGVVAVLAAAGLLMRVLRSAGAGVHAWLVPLLLACSMPFIQSFSHAQNTFTSLLLLTATVTLWRANRGFAAGVVGGLLFYKPQLAAVVCGVLLLDQGLPAVAGVLVSGVSLLTLNLVALPGTLTLWLRGLPANVRWMQIDHAYLWDRHVTLKSFWRLLVQGRDAGENRMPTTILTDLTLAVTALMLGTAAVRFRRNAAICRGEPPLASVRRDRLIAATILSMPLLMPFYFDYDLLLLAVPLVLYVAERFSRPDLARPGDARLTLSWVALYFWSFVNPAVAFHTHVAGSVLLLASVAVQASNRVNRPEGDATPMTVIRPMRVAMAA